MTCRNDDPHETLGNLERKLMSEQPTRLPDKQPTLRVMPMPADSRDGLILDKAKMMETTGGAIIGERN